MSCFPVVGIFFEEENIGLLYLFVSRMYAEDKNDCWHPENHGRHQFR